MFIYKIYSEKGDKVYIGSTKKRYLCNRWADHCSKYRLKNGGHCASYELFNEYGMDECKIQLLEECDDSQRYERERYWITSSPNCINIIKNKYLTKDEKKQYHAEWIQSYKKENPEDYKEKVRKNNQQQKERRSEKILCECGIEYTQNHHKRHRETIRHLNLMKNKIH
jgi:group I intron endonuclease